MRRVTRLASYLAAAALLASTGVASARSPMFQVAALPNLAGGESSSAAAVNDDGSIVGWATTAAGDQHAALWVDGNVVDLGTLPGDTSSYAAAISDSGLIVGASGLGPLAPFDPGNENAHAVLWRDGAIIDLGTLPGGSFSSANGVNDAGQVVGFSRMFDVVQGGAGIRGFLWQDGQMTVLEPLVASSRNVSVSSFATGINDHGQVVGNAASYDLTSNILTRRAVTWNDGTPDDLGTPFGDPVSQGSAINDAGQVVGSSGSVEDVVSLRAVRWTGNRIDGLASPASASFSVATALNRRGVIVGQCAIGEVLRSCRWKASGVTSLLPLAGDLHSTALGVDDNGLVVGYSSDGVRFQAVTWEP